MELTAANSTRTFLLTRVRKKPAGK